MFCLFNIKGVVLISFEWMRLWNWNNIRKMLQCNYDFAPPFLTGRAFIFPPETPLPERPHSEGATYVNIPISPTSKKQLNYMELELQEQGPGCWGAVAHPPPQSKDASILASSCADEPTDSKVILICTAQFKKIQNKKMGGQ